MTAIVLVHGAFHGAWSWDLVREGLDAADVRSVAVELPFTGLADDAGAVRRAIDLVAADAPVVVCGHSYGGRVISRAASGHPAVGGLVYLAAVLNEDSFHDTGDRAAEAAADPSSLMAVVRTDELGRSFVDDDATDHLFHDVDARAAAEARARLRPMAVGPMAPSGAAAVPAAWHDVDTTFVICDDDRSIPPAVQRIMARNADHVRELPTGHSPMLSNPGLVVDVLLDVVDSIPARQPPRNLADTQDRTRTERGDVPEDLPDGGPGGWADLPIDRNIPDPDALGLIPQTPVPDDDADADAHR